MSMASVGSAISVCGCCRADGDRRDARSRGRARTSSARRASSQSRKARRRAAPRRCSVISGRTCIQRRGVHGRGAPTVSGVRRRGEAQRVAGVVVGDVVVADVDGRGDVGEQRPGQRVGQRRRGHAADLQPRRDVGQQLVFGGRTVGGQPGARRPRRRSPVRSPAAGSASGAAVGLRWCPRAAAPRRASCRAAAPRARRRRRPARPSRRRSPRHARGHRTVTFTAGE